MIFLRWTEERLKVLPILNKNGEVENTILLFPGWNFLSNEKYEKVKTLIEEDNRFEIFDSVKSKDKEGKTTNEKLTSFKQIENQKAIEIVRGMNNLQNLDEWLEKETRDEVRVEIKNKIQEILKK